MNRFFAVNEDCKEAKVYDRLIERAYRRCDVTTAKQKKALHKKLHSRYVAGEDQAQGLAMQVFLGENDRAAKAEILGTSVWNVSKMIGRNGRGLSGPTRNKLIEKHYDEIPWPNDLGEWAFGMVAAMKHVQEKMGRESSSVPSPKWCLCINAALENEEWLNAFFKWDRTKLRSVGKVIIGDAVNLLRLERKPTVKESLMIEMEKMLGLPQQADDAFKNTDLLIGWVTECVEACAICIEGCVPSVSTLRRSQ